MNEKIINKRWGYTRKELKQFRKEYDKLNKETQDKLQEIFTSYNITYDKLYKTISYNDKQRLKRKINQWKKMGIYKGYFEFRVEELMKGKITYRDLIEILLYGAYAEEEEELDFKIKTLFSNVALDCYNQGREELKKKKKSIIPVYILNSFGIMLIDGCIWQNYFDALVLTNMQEILKQYLILLQQEKELDAYSKLIQQILDMQRNRLISVSDDKYSGGLDKYTTALGNEAYLGASEFEDVPVIFISDLCENVTEMCKYMDGMIFHTRNINTFKRPMGRTKNDLVIEDVSVKGLVAGINLPPINQHFHWCHSTISYQVEKSTNEFRKEFKSSWYDKLTDYEKDGINRYLSSDSYLLNEKLYSHKELTLQQENFKNDLDSALEMVPKYKGIVNRTICYMNNEHLKNILSIFDNKERIGSWGSYVSSSKDIYDDSMNLWFRIKSKNGRDLSLRNQEGGGEVLFARDTKFKLMTYSKRNDKIIIDLEEIE